MKTMTCTATLCDQRNSSWESGYARQGVYSTIEHRGLMIFKSLANNVMNGKTIKDIGLKIESGGSGTWANKDAHFYTTTKTASGGTSKTWIAAENYAGVIRAKFYNSNLSFSSLAADYPELFAVLKAFFEGGGQSLGIYVDEEIPEGETYSRNYLSFIAVTMTISYVDNNIWRYDGTEWVPCRAYYHNGTEFIPCNAFRHDGADWKL